MRIIISIIFFAFTAALVMCAAVARRSRKKIGKVLSLAIFGILIPVFGNMVIIASADLTMSSIGYYIYFIGMDATVLPLLVYTLGYCDFKWPPVYVRVPVYLLTAGDVIQYILNPFFKHAFELEATIVDGSVYYKLIPHLGQTYHRVLCYGIFLATIIVLIVKMAKTSKIYIEKYAVILISLLITGAIETYYIFSGLPIDISMIGFAVCGLLIFYFSLYYRPLRALDKMLASVASDMPESLFFFDLNGKCLWVNEPGIRLVGTTANNYETVKNDLIFLFGDIDFQNSGWCRRVTLGSGDEVQYTYLEMRSVADNNDNVTGTLLSVRDITDDQRELKREMYNSTHDSLTGLYTKEYLYECIEKRLEEDHATDYMIVYIEIMDFKVINDVFGNKFAELTLKTAAEQIQGFSSDKTLYGKLSTEAFGMLINKSNLDQESVERGLANFNVSDGNMDHHIIIHVGIYDISEEDQEIDVPLFFDSARLATRTIRDDYSNLIAFYDDKLRNQIIYDQLLTNQLHDAIDQRQIRPYLQPIVDEKGLLMGAEALVRWIHPDEGFLSPGKFIPVFERNGLIAEVDRYMWRCACEILADWKKRGINKFISINISPKDFYFMDVVKEIKDLVAEFDIDPVNLRIEITETVMMTEAADRIKLVDDLRASGFIVEMDDFGSGYSSLNLLKDMPVDVLKIDMQFLKDSERNMRAGMIIKNIINMSEDLGIASLTEGVETAAQFEKLYAMGCKLYQGYYFSKPVPREDFEKQWFD